MAEGITVEVIAQKNALPRLIRRLPFYADAVARTVAEDALEVMQSLTPVGPDEQHDFDRYPEHLRESEHVEHMGPGIYGIAIDNDYWPYPNYGTVYQAAQPFVEPAIDEARASAETKAAIVFKGWEAEGAL